VIIRGRHVDNGLVVSATAHVAVLLWAGISFAGRPYVVPPMDTVEVDVVSANELSQMTAGSKTAPKKAAPQKLVEKKAPPKAVEHPEAKVADKEIITASAAPEPPKEVEPPMPKPVPHEAKVEPKPKPKPPEKVVPDAEALHKSEKKKEEPKKDEAKTEPKKEPPKKEVKHEPKKPEPKPKPKVARKPDAPKFDFDRIAALLDKRQPQRLASTGDVVNHNPSRGTTTGTAQTLTQSELDALRARIEACWQLPPGGLEIDDLRVDIHVRFNPDGSLAEPPRLLTHTTSSYQNAVAASAVRAIERCAPYTFLPVAKYQVWKEIEMGFDPRDRVRG
jgi:colicin import membrane protein